LSGSFDATKNVVTIKLPFKILGLRLKSKLSALKVTRYHAWDTLSASGGQDFTLAADFAPDTGPSPCSYVVGQELNK
jgi:hypothetical protein